MKIFRGQDSRFFSIALIYLAMGYLYRSPMEAIITDQSTMVEVCDNGIDDDQDGHIDLNDSDCSCDVIVPVSLIPNPSFEDMTCCPNNRSQLNCADVWIQASEPTTDYLHTCGWMGWDNFPPPLPFPDGEGIMGFRDGRNIMGTPEYNWKEYAGACLLSPLEANKKYRFQFDVGFVDRISSPPISISFFGSPDCQNLPFGQGNDDFGCPTNGSGWSFLGSILVSGNNADWVKTLIDVTPDEDINAIAIGPPCSRTSSMQSTYYFFDNLILDDARSFDFVISEIGHPCAADFALAIPEEEGYNYQWYKEGIALMGETSYQLSRIYGEGDYQVRTTTGGLCNVTKKYNYRIPVIAKSEKVQLCEGQSYRFGNSIISSSGEYVETFKNIDNCDSTVTLTVQALGIQADSITVKIFEGEQYEIGNYNLSSLGEHLVILSSSLGCDSLVYVDLSFYNIYLPNIFSPNDDGQNDRFNVIGNDDLVDVINLTIYNNWGEEVYNGNNLDSNESDGWDGTKSGQPVQPGVYVYVATVLMTDGIERRFASDVMVIY